LCTERITIMKTAADQQSTSTRQSNLYRYEIGDIYFLLKIRIAVLEKVVIDTPIYVLPNKDDPSFNGLEQALLQAKQVNVGIPCKVLIPVDLGARWVGVAIAFLSNGIVTATYVDSTLQDHVALNVPDQIVSILNQVYPNITIMPVNYFVHSDPAGSGPLTVENLLLATLEAPSQRKELSDLTFIQEQHRNQLDAFGFTLDLPSSSERSNQPFKQAEDATVNITQMLSELLNAIENQGPLYNKNLMEATYSNAVRAFKPEHRPWFKILHSKTPPYLIAAVATGAAAFTFYFSPFVAGILSSVGLVGTSVYSLLKTRKSSKKYMTILAEIRDKYIRQFQPSSNDPRQAIDIYYFLFALGVITSATGVLLVGLSKEQEPKLAASVLTALGALPLIFHPIVNKRLRSMSNYFLKIIDTGEGMKRQAEVAQRAQKFELIVAQLISQSKTIESEKNQLTDDLQSTRIHAENAEKLYQQQTIALRGQLDMVKSELENSKAQIAAEHEKLQSAQVEIEQKDKKIQGLDEQLDKTNQKVIEQDSMISNLQETKKQTEETLNERTHQLVESQQQSQQLTLELQNTQTQLHEAKETAQRKLAEKNDDIQRLQYRLDNMSKELIEEKNKNYELQRTKHQKHEMQEEHELTPPEASEAASTSTITSQL
jgi:hypothetical protein